MFVADIRFALRTLRKSPDSTNVVTMSFQLVMGRDVDGDRLTRYVDQVLETVRAVPGVRDAAMTSALPLRGWGFGMPYRIAGRASDPSRRPACFFKIVTPGYFGTLSMNIRKGRALAESDAKGALPVTVVNEAFARAQFPDQDPIGQHVMIEQIITGKRELGPEVAVRGRLGSVSVSASRARSARRDGSRLLFETRPNDPPTPIVVGALLLVVAIGACYVPARRAAGVDPMTALRVE